MCTGMEGRPARLTGSSGELTECYERNAGFQNYWGEPHPLGSISLWKIGGRRRQFLPLFESTKFSKEKFNDPFLLTVIRPRRKTPVSPYIDDRCLLWCCTSTLCTCTCYMIERPELPPFASLFSLSIIEHPIIRIMIFLHFFYTPKN